MGHISSKIRHPSSGSLPFLQCFSSLNKKIKKKLSVLSKRTVNNTISPPSLTYDLLKTKEYLSLSPDDLQRQINSLKKGIIFYGIKKRLLNYINSNTLNDILHHYLDENSTENKQYDSSFSDTESTHSENTLFLDEPRYKDAKTFLRNFEKTNQCTINTHKINNFLTLFAGCEEILHLNHALTIKQAFPEESDTLNIANNILEDQEKYKIFSNIYSQYQNPKKYKIFSNIYSQYNNKKNDLIRLGDKDKKDKKEILTEEILLKEIPKFEETLVKEISEYLETNIDAALQFYTIINLLKDIKNLQKEVFSDQDIEVEAIKNNISKNAKYSKILKGIAMANGISQLETLNSKHITMEEDEKIEHFLNVNLEGYNTPEKKLQLLQANKAFYEAVKEFQTTSKYPDISSSSSSTQSHDVLSKILESSASGYNDDIRKIVKANTLKETESHITKLEKTKPIITELKETESNIITLEKEISRIEQTSKYVLSSSTPKITQTHQASSSHNTSQPINPQQILEEPVEAPLSTSEDKTQNQLINTQNTLITIRRYREDIFPDCSLEDIVNQIKNNKNILLSLYHKANPNTHASDADIIQKVIHHPETYPDISLKFYATLAHIKLINLLTKPILNDIKKLINDSNENISDKYINIYQNLLQSSNDMALFNEKDFYKRLLFLESPQHIKTYIDQIYSLQTTEAPSDIFLNDNSRSFEQEFASTIPTEETAKSYPIQDSLTSHSLPIVDSHVQQTPEASEKAPFPVSLLEKKTKLQRAETFPPTASSNLKQPVTHIDETGKLVRASNPTSMSWGPYSGMNKILEIKESLLSPEPESFINQLNQQGRMEKRPLDKAELTWDTSGGTLKPSSKRENHPVQDSKSSPKTPKEYKTISLINQYKHIFPDINSVRDILATLNNPVIKEEFLEICKKNKLSLSSIQKKTHGFGRKKINVTPEEFDDFIQDALLNNKNNVANDFYMKKYDALPLLKPLRSQVTYSNPSEYISHINKTFPQLISKEMKNMVENTDVIQKQAIDLLSKEYQAKKLHATFASKVKILLGIEPTKHEKTVLGIKEDASVQLKDKGKAPMREQ